MSNPIIIVSGKARSGKDTVAEHIAKNYNGVCIAQADPMKRYAKYLLGFTDQTLWGPSEARNAFISLKDLQLGDPGRASECLAVDMFDQGTININPQSSFARTLEEWYVNHVQARIRKDEGISARVVLQTLGIEWGRKFAPKMWIERAILNSRLLVEGGFAYTREEGMVPAERAFDYAIITDGRFRNEVLATTFLGGVAFRVRRPDTDGEGATTGVAGHRSEMELDTIPEHFYTGTIMNDSTLADLYGRVDDEMAIHYGDTRIQ